MSHPATGPRRPATRGGLDVVRTGARLVRAPVTGAMAGQVTLALSGLVLQVAAARALGAAGLATWSLAYGVVVLATALASGLVGDSLTVLDRHRPDTRAGLHAWAVLLAVSTALVCGMVASLSGWSAGAALLLVVAAAAFVVEDLLRRLLMASRRFWSLTAVDVTSLVVGLACLVGAAAALGPLTLGSFALALAGGQTAAALVAWALLPASERPRGPWRAPALRAVFSFGVWRAAGQAIRPALLTVMRLLVLGVLGAAAYGPLEAARIVTAPTLLVVTGLGSFLLPHVVGLRTAAPATSLRAADRAAWGLAAAVTAVGAAVVLALPVIGPALTGGSFAVPAGAVAAWSLYAVASAMLLPYASMASAHHRPRAVLAARSTELLSLGGVVLLVLLGPGAIVWAPLALAVGPVLAAALLRARILVPLTRHTPGTASSSAVPQSVAGGHGA